VIADEHSPASLRLLGERVRLRRAERRLLRLPKRVFALSRTDATVLRNWGAVAEPLPIPVLSQAEPVVERPNTVGFIGKASWPPNAGALRALLGPVHEELVRLDSDVRFVLAGRGTEEFAGHPRVISSGWVADEAEFYARTGLVVVPRFGASTGISVKMVEAAEFGVPALVPRALADAVDPDGPWLVADEPAAIAEAVAKWSVSGRGSDVRDWVGRNDPARTGALLTSVLMSP
jgi:glycosyltransferase involved in cell wall biosynthesis